VHDRKIFKMKQFNLGLMIIFIASKWWVLTLFLTLVAGVLAYIKQMGASTFSWPYVITCGLWGGGVGLLFFTSNVRRGQGIVAPLLSASVMVAIAATTGFMLAWDVERTLIVAAGGLVLGLLAPRWISYLNLG
jgi:hypothetical protein